MDEYRLDFPASVRRLNRLIAALAADSYLEIGVFRAGTFSRIEAPTRIGVDPRFRADIGPLAAMPGVRLVESTSDAWFGTLPPESSFDVAFLDGLHLFEQTYRDLCNVLAHAHRRTVVLLDDTVPIDVYSSLRDARQTLQYRRASGSERQDWHGDAYKVVFMIHDFHPSLDYRTIVGSGNGQTLVWRSNAGPREPVFDSIDAIARLSYFDAMDRMQVFRNATEDEAIAACLEGLGVVPTPGA